MCKLFKKLFMITIPLLAVLFFINPVQAEVSMSSGFVVSAPNDKSLTDMVGIELKTEWNDLFLTLSKESAYKHLVGQTVGEYNIYGAVLGYDLHPFKYFSISCGIGYYQPKIKYESEMVEAVYREMHRLSDPVDGWKVNDGVLCCGGYELDYDMNTCEYKASGNFGGMIRFNLDVPITNRTGISFFAGYRILDFHTRISAKIKGLPPRAEDGLQAFHVFSGKDSFSGGQVGVFLNIRW